jgi:hypothetical protein
MLTTPLFEVQIEQLGLDLPLTALVLVSLRALQRSRHLAALLYSVLAFFMKSTGLLLTGGLVACFLLLACIYLWQRQRHLAGKLGLLALLGGGLIGLELALIAWGDTTIAVRLSNIWPRILSLQYGLQWVPDFGFLLFAAALGSGRCLYLLLRGDRPLADQSGRTFGERLTVLAPLLLASAILMGLMAAIARYIFIPRYVTLAIPLAYIVAVSPWFLGVRRGHWGRPVGFGLVLAAITGFNLANAAGRFYPALGPMIARTAPGLSWWHARMCAVTERSREYLEDHRSALAAMRLLEDSHAGAPIITDMPYAWYLTKPRLGYVTKPLTNVTSSRDYRGTIDTFLDAATKQPPQSPIFVFAAKSQARFPDPGAHTEILYEDDLHPKLILYRVRLEELPASRTGLEDWYLDASWQDDFLAQRALDRTHYLEGIDRAAQSMRELYEASDRTPKNAFLAPFIADRLRELRDKQPAPPASRPAWTLSVQPGSQATIEQEAERARCIITEPGTGPAWRIQIRHPGPHLSDDAARIAFDARADSPRPVRVGIGRASPPWENLGLDETIELSPEWKHFDFELKPTQTDISSSLTMDLGDSEAAVEIRNVRLSPTPVAISIRGVEKQP